MAADGGNMIDAAELADAVQSDQKNCGLIMPIAECDGCSPSHWLEVRSIISSAVSIIASPKFTTKMVSDGEATGTIQGRIVRNVYNNEIVVCDVSGRNPNVLFELGLRIAFDRPVVLIKDDATDFAFDIGPLEHLVYPRSLRHGPIEQFKQDLARKVLGTHQDWYSPTGERPSYIKAFGPITTVEFERKTESSDQAIFEAIAGLGRKVDAIALAGKSSASAARGIFRGPSSAARYKSELSLDEGRDLFRALSDDAQRSLTTAFRNKIKADKSITNSYFSEFLHKIDPSRTYSDQEASAIMDYFVAAGYGV